jgi:hypothetical protein
MNLTSRYRHQQPEADRGYSSIGVALAKKSRILFDVRGQQPGTRPEGGGENLVDGASMGMPG